MTELRLGMIRFPTKGEAAAFVREILWRHPVGTELADLEHYAITKLYRLHPNRDQSIDIQRHVIGWNTGMGYREGTRGFHTILASGERDIWSYKAPLSPYDAKSWWMTAARGSWIPHAIAWKAKRGGKCESCGQSAAWRDLDVHHNPPWTFKEIVRAYAGDRLPSIEIVDGQNVLADAASFIEFHNERAVLSLLCKTCHRRSSP